MYKKFNWLEHIEHFDQNSKKHLSMKSKQTKFNYENVDSKSRCSKGRKWIERNFGKYSVRHFNTREDDEFSLSKTTKCRSPDRHSSVNSNRNSNRMIKSNKTNSPFHTHRQITARMPHHNISIKLRLLFTLTMVAILVESIELSNVNKLPIKHPSNHLTNNLIASRSSLIYDLSNRTRLDISSFEPVSKDRFRRTIAIRQQNKQKPFTNKARLLSKRLVSYNENNENAFSSETIVELQSHQLISKRMDNYLERNQTINNMKDLNASDLNETILNDESTMINDEMMNKTEAPDSEFTNKQDTELRMKQERILNEIDEINEGHRCSSLNKQTHFKTKGSKDATNESRDKKYWLMLKALEPKFLKMPSLTENQMQLSQEIKNYYHELIEKLELIASILYDNAEQINAAQHLQLMRKIIRELSLLHPHIMRARLISLNLNNKAYRKRRHSSPSFAIDFNNLEETDNVEFDDDDEKLTNVPYRRIARQESIRTNNVEEDRLNAYNDVQIDNFLNESGRTSADNGKEWLNAKNIFFYMRGEQESVHEFQDVTLTTKPEHVSWLDIMEVEEKSSTLKEFNQLLTQGHLFAVNEKERLFSGYTGIYFDCAMRRWLFSYTSLLVSCNQCSSRKQSTVSVNNELEMRLIGLLSVDIDLQTMDLNQCDSPKYESTELVDVLTNANSSNKSVSNNERTKIPQSTNTNNQQTNYQINDAIKSNAQYYRQKYYRDDSFDDDLMRNEFQLNAHSLGDEHLQFNDSLLINQPQRLVKRVFTSKNNHSSSGDKSNRFTNHRLMLHLARTNKCHQATSQCHFIANGGIRKGSYVCKCKPGYFAVLHQFPGLEVERAWEYQYNKKQNTIEKADTYDRMYICKKCSPGCDTCVDLTPCLSTYNWAFRISLLTISILCIVLIFVLTYYIYKYRKIKVFKVASPTFLSLTLLGCAIMYSEMIFIFPVLNSGFCIMTKITRHMGFCLTYSALLLKTWRVSLTYRVKSAHKLKLTDRQLLQWLFPILLVMTIFLGTWIISDPPKEIIIQDWNKLKFTICEYNWFDHSLAIGEFFFLLWGIKVCYNVRNAESFFNEAKYITWAVGNISIINILMILIHIIILPNAGPDLKYFLGFVRTQLSTTTTILLIFGPKFYRLIKGEGDSWNANFARRGINASFSLNGVGVVHEELTDLYQENEELKEQVHKLATQVELMRLRQMRVNNRHLKSKHTISSGASSQVALNSTVVNSANVTGLVGLAAATATTAGPHFHSYSYNQLNPQVDSAGIGLVTGLVGGIVGGTGVSGLTFSQTQPTACQRISPAAELQSEKV